MITTFSVLSEIDMSSHSTRDEFNDYYYYLKKKNFCFLWSSKAPGSWPQIFKRMAREQDARNKGSGEYDRLSGRKYIYQDFYLQCPYSICWSHQSRSQPGAWPGRSCRCRPPLVVDLYSQCTSPCPLHLKSEKQFTF